MVIKDTLKHENISKQFQKLQDCFSWFCRKCVVLVWRSGGSNKSITNKMFFTEYYSALRSLPHSCQWSTARLHKRLFHNSYNWVNAYAKDVLNRGLTVSTFIRAVRFKLAFRACNIWNCVIVWYNSLVLLNSIILLFYKNAFTIKTSDLAYVFQKLWTRKADQYPYSPYSLCTQEKARFWTE